jgi:hypothetical protein
MAVQGFDLSLVSAMFAPKAGMGPAGRCLRPEPLFKGIPWQSQS